MEGPAPVTARDGSFTPAELNAAHDRSYRNRTCLFESVRAGCFHCLATYPAEDVKEFIRADGTAVCPRCGIDAVMGDAASAKHKSDGFKRWPITNPDFLMAMQKFWFQTTFTLEQVQARLRASKLGHQSDSKGRKRRRL